MLKRPLVPVTIAFAAGILAAGTDRMTFLVAACLIVPAVLASLTRPALRSAVVLLILVFVLGFCRAWIWAEIAPDDICRLLKWHPPMFTGVVVSEPEVRNGHLSLTIMADHVLVAGRWRQCSGRVWTTIYGESRKYRPLYDDRVCARAVMSEPEDDGNPGSFSWKRYLARQRIYSTARVDEEHQIRLLVEGRRSPITLAAEWTRRTIDTGVDDLFEQPAASVVSGMTLGSYSILPDDVVEDFSRTGTLHLLAASGFNCGLIAAGLGYPLRRLGLTKRTRHTILIAALVLYMLVVGLKASIVRATIMASLMLFATCIRRPGDLINLLFTAAAVILFLSPSDLYDVGFQLSFAAVFGLIIAEPPIGRFLRSRTQTKPNRSPGGKAVRWLKRQVVGAVSSTLVATILTAPITAQTFSQFSLVALPANAIVAVAALPVFALGAVSPIAAHVPLLDFLVRTAGTLAASAVLIVVRFFGSSHFSCVSVRPPGWIAITGYYLIAAAAAQWVHSYASRR